MWKLAVGAAAMVRLILAADAPGPNQVMFDGNTAGMLGKPIDQFVGAGIHIEDKLPTFGKLTLHSESLGHDGRYLGGEDFLRLEGAHGAALKWRLTAGDFRRPTNQLDALFGNFSFPEITARGVDVEIENQVWRYSFYSGTETLPPSPNNLFRILVPQRVTAAAAQRALGKRLRAGVRWSHLSSSPHQLELMQLPTFAFPLPPERRFASVHDVLAQLIFTVNKHLRLYGEATPATAHKFATSAAGGAAWDSSRLTIKANYARQGLTYAPWVGYGSGDRSGPFAEFRYQVTKRLVLNGSSSESLNNVEHDPARTDVRMVSSNAGASLVLPWKLTAGAQMNDTGLTIRSPGGATPFYAGNLQMNASLGRTVRKNNVRFYLRELRLASPDRSVSRLQPEIEDMIQTKNFTAGGAVRVQDQFPGFRGVAETRLARLTAHADVETGNLTPSSVSSRTSLNVMNLRGTARLGKTWTVEAQSSRVWLTNPQLIMRQWNVSFRLIKHFS